MSSCFSQSVWIVFLERNTWDFGEFRAMRSRLHEFLRSSRLQRVPCIVLEIHEFMDLNFRFSLRNKEFMRDHSRVPESSSILKRNSGTLHVKQLFVLTILELMNSSFLKTNGTREFQSVSTLESMSWFRAVVGSEFHGELEFGTRLGPGPRNPARARAGSWRSFANNSRMRCATVILMPNSDSAWNFTSIGHFLSLFRVFMVRFAAKVRNPARAWAHIGSDFGLLLKIGP